MKTFKVFYDDSPTGAGKSYRQFDNITGRSCKVLFIIEQTDRIIEFLREIGKRSVVKGSTPTLDAISSKAGNRRNSVASQIKELPLKWAVDRLGRSLQNLVGFLTEINAKGVDLYLHQQALDTSTPSGRAMFGMLSVFADFERELIRSRIMAGLARSTKKPGRPALDADKVARIERTLASGLSINATARKLRCGVGTVHRIKQRMDQAA